jgi:hypothetical protein
MKLRILIILFTTVFLASCQKDLLDKVPTDSPSSSTFFSNENELRLAINSAYRTFYWFDSNEVPYNMWLDGTTDITWIRGDYSNMQTIQSGQASPQTPVFNSIWAFHYEAISRSNNILVNMHRAKDKVAPAFYNRIEAEAKFLRAYSYNYLISLYGDVPYVVSMLSIADAANYPKTAKEEIVTKLMTDLDFAIENLPKTYSGVDNGRITKGAALTLKARIALYNGKFDIAAKAAKDVMDLGVYSVYSNYENLFKKVGANSSEAILSLPYLTGLQTTQTPRYLGTRGAPGYSVIVPTQVMIDMYQCTDGKRIDQSTLFDPTDQFKNRDPRLDQSILRPGQWYNGYLFQTHPDARTTQRNINGVISNVGNLEVTNAFATFTGYIWRKYFDDKEVATITKSDIPLMLMRYAEVLLTYAEAKVELNQIDQSVIDAINLVRRRPSVNMPAATITMTQVELRDLVRYERTVELAQEGFRLFDIRRWKTAEHVLPGNVLGRRIKERWYDAVTPQFNVGGKPTYTNETQVFQVISSNQFNPQRDYLWPIPQKELDLNKGLTQNPNYN